MCSRSCWSQGKGNLIPQFPWLWISLWWNSDEATPFFCTFAAHAVSNIIIIIITVLSHSINTRLNKPNSMAIFCQGGSARKDFIRALQRTLCRSQEQAKSQESQVLSYIKRHLLGVAPPGSNRFQLELGQEASGLTSPKFSLSEWDGIERKFQNKNWTNSM